MSIFADSLGAVAVDDDDELAALAASFAKLGDIRHAYLGSSAPDELASHHDVGGHWVTWRFAHSSACCLLQAQHRTAAEQLSPPPLYVQWRDTRAIERLDGVAVRYKRHTSAGSATYPSMVLEGEMIDRRAQSLPPLFVAWQCLWQLSASRASDDTQLRMISARQMVGVEPLSGRPPPLAADGDRLAVEYRRVQTPTQARSVFARPPPQEMADWPLLDGCVVVRVNGDAHVPAATNGIYWSASTDAEALSTRVRRQSAAAPLSVVAPND